jgi:hypothetical protein
VLLEDGTIYELTVEQLEGREPIELKKAKGADTWNGAHARALEAILPGADAERAETDSEKSDDDAAQRERARRRERPKDRQPQESQSARTRNDQSREPKGRESCRKRASKRTFAPQSLVAPTRRAGRKT